MRRRNFLSAVGAACAAPVSWLFGGGRCEAAPSQDLITEAMYWKCRCECAEMDVLSRNQTITYAIEDCEDRDGKYALDILRESHTRTTHPDCFKGARLLDAMREMLERDNVPGAKRLGEKPLY